MWSLSYNCSFIQLPYLLLILALIQILEQNNNGPRWPTDTQITSTIVGFTKLTNLCEGGRNFTLRSYLVN